MPWKCRSGLQKGQPWCPWGQRKERFPTNSSRVQGFLNSNLILCLRSILPLHSVSLLPSKWLNIEIPKPAASFLIEIKLQALDPNIKVAFLCLCLSPLKSLCLLKEVWEYLLGGGSGRHYANTCIMFNALSTPCVRKGRKKELFKGHHRMKMQ